MHEVELERAATHLARARRVVVFTGAGISRESGIPTFRDPDGLWSRYPIEQFGTVPGLLEVARRDPARVVRFIGENLSTFLAASPNAGHRAIAQLELRAGCCDVVTQNIDDLHERAGSTAVHKLHGDLFTLRCTVCGERLACDVDSLTKRALPFVSLSLRERELHPEDLAAALPHCEACGGPQRLDVVLFGESLPHDAWERASAAVSRCDCLLMVGTTAEVAPASSLPTMALQMGVPVLEINPRPVLARAAATLAGPAGQLLPRLVALLPDARPVAP